MRVIIATRIFGPEISAASGILRIWSEKFRDRGHSVTVLTSQPPKGSVVDDPQGVDVRRAPVKRDRQNYVRGYLSYMSFDIPLACRLLFGRKADLYVVEPPPTTVAVVRVIAALRRTPYVVRAADYWTEAAELVTSSKLIIGTLKRLEIWGLNGAAKMFAAHEPLLTRLREVGVTAPATAIGFGADTKDFSYQDQEPPGSPVFLYAGTYSEWHGSMIFVEAMPRVLASHPSARLVFYGNGEDRPHLTARAAELGVTDSVSFNGPIAPSALSPILASATISVASLAPVPANEYALATKVYSSLAAGCPVIFAGVGPTIEFIADASAQHAGVAVAYDSDAVADAMIAAAGAPLPVDSRRRLAEWSSTRYSLDSIGDTVVEESLIIAARRI